MVFTMRYLSLLLSLSSLTDAAPRCRCLYGQACWPNETTFASLASQLSQPLLHPVPPASACYPISSPSGNCSDVTTHSTDGDWRADHPGAMQNPNFETFLFPNGTVEGCYLNVTLGLPCKQGNVPPIGVDARSVKDIQAAVVFAKRNNLRLVVKNTGHDYLGRSAGRGGFLVWTHQMKNMSYDESFVPQGAPPRSKTFDAVTFGAGVQWHDAYDFAQKQGRFVLGGISHGGTVGSAGGWVMGGGHSAFAPSFGLGVDNAIQFSVVLADGTYLVVNSYRHSDLFWALRGGGGGTYGVVTSATYQTHPIFPLTMSALITNFSSPEIAQDVVTEFVKLHPTLSDAGWGGYSALSKTNFQVLYVAPNVSLADANATFWPFVSYVSNATKGDVQTYSYPFPSFIDWYTAIFLQGGSQVGSQVEIVSRLLPRTLAEEDPAKAAAIMLSVDGGVAINSVAGGAVSRVNPSSTGLNPSWRNAVAHVYCTESWPEGASGPVILQARDRLKKNTDILDGITKDSGSYLNEGSLYEKDFKKSYFGSHYQRLRVIESKYDPSSLFVVASGVGSDEWHEGLRCRL